MSANDAVVYTGSRFVVECLRLEDGFAPVLEFLDGLSDGDRAKLQALFVRLGDHGEIKNQEKCRKESANIYALKSFQIRILWFHTRHRRIILAHAFVKKRDRLRPQDLQKAERLREMYIRLRGEAP